MTAAVCAITAALAACPSAVAQSPAASPTAIDPAFAAAQAAYNGLPEVDRRAIQDALIWTGDYKGIVDGQFGRGTRDSIIAYAKRSHLPSDGTLDDKARAALFATAAKAKQTVGFAAINDPRSGVRLAMPQKLLPKVTALKSGTRYASTDAATTLETTADSADDLPSLFTQLTASASGRRITYKVLRPDFLVVAGTTPTGSFYTRMARSTTGGTDVVRGYTFSYPNAVKAQFDMASVAIADAFEPFPAAASPPAPPPAAPKLVANGLAIGANRLLAVLPGGCTGPQVSGRSASIVRRDETTSLALLEVEGATFSRAAFPALRIDAADPGTPIVALFEAARTDADKSAVELIATAGETAAALVAGGAARVAASLQGPVTGAAIFDRNGALIGMVAAVSQAPRQVAGIVPRSTYPLIAASALAAWIGRPETQAQAAMPPADRTAAEIVKAAGSLVLPVSCAL
ncbi:MAG TPA: peptidoglycan-binding domain-containing protein [Beijerinckiaceae bacterium]|nr:peptidoglycan-binding domain-containing protein [Beijerinckiaceae bacterium]